MSLFHGKQSLLSIARVLNQHNFNAILLASTAQNQNKRLFLNISKPLSWSMTNFKDTGYFVLYTGHITILL